jgi:hypothetical protein
LLYSRPLSALLLAWLTLAVQRAGQPRGRRGDRRPVALAVAGLSL